MSDLLVFGFEGEFGAAHARRKFEQLEREHLVNIEDAVVVVRHSEGKFDVSQLHNLALAGALGGGFWGALIGLIFMSPFFGFGIGAAAGAVAGQLSDIGISDDFVKQLAHTLKEESSALFVLLHEETPDRVREELKDLKAQVLHTSLRKTDEIKLRKALESARKDRAATKSDKPERQAEEAGKDTARKSKSA